MDPIKNSIKLRANLGKRATETLAMIRQEFGENSMSRTKVFKWHDLFRAEQSQEQIMFGSKGIVHK
jgi:hypothetical protein